jgi:hypothetical protein
MLGKKHTPETKAKMKNKDSPYNNPFHPLSLDDNRQKLSDRMAKMQADGVLKNNYSRAKHGTVSIGNKAYFFRSSWEANIAAYFEFLKNKNEIKEWEYETDTFWFENIKRGVRSYKPDFKITKNDGTQYYIEVKGWMDSKSKTKLNRMRIYYPSVKIEVLAQDRYREISKYSSIIPEWGKLENIHLLEFERCSVGGCENKSFKKNLCRKHYYKVYKK